MLKAICNAMRPWHTKGSFKPHTHNVALAEQRMSPVLLERVTRRWAEPPAGPDRRHTNPMAYVGDKPMPGQHMLHHESGSGTRPGVLCGMVGQMENIDELGVTWNLKCIDMLNAKAAEVINQVWCSRLEASTEAVNRNAMDCIFETLRQKQAPYIDALSKLLDGTPYRDSALHHIHSEVETLHDSWTGHMNLRTELFMNDFDNMVLKKLSYAFADHFRENGGTPTNADFTALLGSSDFLKKLGINADHQALLQNMRFEPWAKRQAFQSSL